MEWPEINTSVYSKSTDSHTYLDYHSFHPIHIKESIVFSQMLRYKRICSDSLQFRSQSTTMIGHFRDCNYWREPWTRSLEFPGWNCFKINIGRGKRIVFRFSLSTAIRSIHSSGWSKMNGTRWNRETWVTFLLTPVVTTRQPHSLRNILVRSRFPSTDTSELKRNAKCGKPPCCKVCHHIITDHDIHLSPSWVCFHPDSYNCDTPCLI